MTHFPENFHALGNITGTVKLGAITVSQDKKYHSIKENKHHMDTYTENSVF